MGEIEIKTEKENNLTVISNSFIERYMADANGAYVKLYLYLLYCKQSGNAFTLASACDFLGDTEKDIIRALKYWEKIGLISILKAENQIRSLTLIDLEHAATKSEIAHFLVPTTPVTSPVPKEGNLLEVEETCKSSNRDNCEEDIHFIMAVAEKYIARLLNSADMGLICDLYEKMNFSTDLIIHLFEYCADIGKTDFKYIEKVAMNWADEGIKTVEQAREASTKYNINYLSVMKSLGLHRLPGNAEKEYIDKWNRVFSMPLEVILEACDRALLAVGKPDFRYIDGILKKWNDASLKSLSAIKQDDSLHSANTTVSKKGSPAEQKRPRPQTYEQRSYSEEEMKKLEKKLLKNY